MEELSKKLADHDQASKAQQQKLKVGQLGDGPVLCLPQSEDGGGKVLSKPLGCDGCRGRGGAPWGPGSLKRPGCGSGVPACAFWELSRED